MNIRKIAEEAVRLYFDGYSAHEAIEKAKEMYGYGSANRKEIHCHGDSSERPREQAQ